METTQPALFTRLARTPSYQAARDVRHDWSTYAELLNRSALVAQHLLSATGNDDLDGARVAFGIEPSVPYMEWLIGIWLAGGVAAPLPLHSPPLALARTVADLQPILIVADDDRSGALAPVADDAGVRLLASAVDIHPTHQQLPTIEEERDALILYTSGTTGPPKGVVHSHGTLRAQIESLVDAWGWRQDDRILLALPLHHIHGIVNVCLSALWTGAQLDILPGFDADQVASRLSDGDLTLFMAVPTIYRELLDWYQGAPANERKEFTTGARRARLMVSGSAALPVTTLQEWRNATGQLLLERYGMTEIGMALSNPLHGERSPGRVGWPLARVQTRVIADGGTVADEGASGELQIRGPAVFRRYWRRPDATSEAFTADGWFKTGDVVRIEPEGYRILGRESVDILKTGGEKVSALEVEATLREHQGVADCAVVGLEDRKWGQRISAAVVGDASVGAETLRAWCRDRLEPYKVPKTVTFVDSLPRNAMGKVDKPQLAELLGRI